MVKGLDHTRRIRIYRAIHFPHTEQEAYGAIKTQGVKKTYRRYIA
jgi:hypothetical protein